MERRSSIGKFTNVGYPVVYPNGIYEQWEEFVFVTVLLALCSGTFQSSFDSSYISLWVIAYASDVVYLVDMILTFFVAYHFEGQLVTDPIRIRQRYLSTTFFIDVLTIVPTDILTIGNSNPILATVRANRLLRMHRVIAFYGKCIN